MMLSSVMLGAVFVGIGYLISVLVRERGTAGGVAIGVWLLFVLIYDMAFSVCSFWTRAGPLAATCSTPCCSQIRLMSTVCSISAPAMSVRCPAWAVSRKTRHFHPPS